MYISSLAGRLDTHTHIIDDDDNEHISPQARQLATDIENSCWTHPNKTFLYSSSTRNQKNPVPIKKPYITTFWEIILKI